ncbi:hypothetical protein [Nocardia asiatica]|uniref:hypothetical protein n=1 Tax=Nocardia asiatica TaxID=209252 RepID=UPI0024566F08|nr:hypothetical protein [Nocardia asiatica]
MIFHNISMPPEVRFRFEHDSQKNSNQQVRRDFGVEIRVLPDVGRKLQGADRGHPRAPCVGPPVAGADRVARARSAGGHRLSIDTAARDRRWRHSHQNGVRTVSERIAQGTSSGKRQVHASICVGHAIGVPSTLPAAMRIETQSNQVRHRK